MSAFQADAAAPERKTIYGLDYGCFHFSHYYSTFTMIFGTLPLRHLV